MTPAMQQLVSDFAALRAENPPDDVSASTRFQQFLVFEGKQHDFSPEDLSEAAHAIGLSPDEVSDFMDSLASWL